MSAGKTKLTLVLLPLLTLLAASCSHREVSEGSVFRYAEVSKTSPAPSFTFEMSDSGFVYRIALVAVFSDNYAKDSLPLLVKFISPSGNTAEERISLPADFESVKKYVTAHDDHRIRLSDSPTGYEVECVYRENILPSESGVWTITLDPQERKHLCGIGAVCSRIILVSNSSRSDEQKR